MRTAEPSGQWCCARCFRRPWRGVRLRAGRRLHEAGRGIVPRQARNGAAVLAATSGVDACERLAAGERPRADRRVFRLKGS